MLDDKEIPQEDVVDKALLDIVHEVFGDDYDDEELDGALDVILAILDELIDTGDAEEMPENEAPEEEKNDWVARFRDKLKQAVIDGVTLGEPENDQNLG